ncbi:ATP-binding cassette domain-containing protein [Mycoplasmatota bacterium WC44]
MLTIKNVDKTYYSLNGDECRALNKINLRFSNNGLVFITGKSGSGKSTLLNVLGGLDKIDSGEIIIKNKSSEHFSNEDFDSYRNTYLGFVFQDFGILENLTVEENISLTLKLQSYKKDEISKKVRDILGQVDLAGFSKRASNELSGGQLQRVAIARALVKNPEIILADEPTGNLDSETGIQIMNLLKSLSKNKLIIVVSHDTEFANLYADRIINLKDGSVIEDYVVTRKVFERKVTQKKLISKKSELSDVLPTRKLHLKKTKLPFKYIFKTALNNLVNKKIKLILTLFLFVVSLFTLSISTLLSDFDISTSTINTMDMNEVDNVLIRKCHDFQIDYSEVFDIDECSFKSISEDETELINDISLNLDAESYRLINERYPLPVVKSIYFETVDFYTPSKIYGFMEIPEESIFDIIDGHYPTDSNEVMITDYLINFILEFLEIPREELIGSTFKYGEQVLTITGVIKTDHEKYLHFKSIDTASMSDEELKLLQVEYSQFILESERLYSRFLLPKKSTDSNNNNFIDRVKLRSENDTFLGYINFRTDLDKSLMLKENVLTYPETLEPLTDNEIYLDLFLFLERKLAYQDNFDMTDYSSDKVLSDLTIMDEFIGNEYLFNFEYNDVMYTENFKIKGFYIPNISTENYESNELKDGIITSIDIPSKLLNKTYDGYYLKLSDSSYKNIKLFKELNDNGYVQISSYSDHLYLVYGITKDIHHMLLYSTIGLGVFSCVLIYVSISNSINDKQKDIGILRSIGTSGIDVGSIFLTESLLLATISITIAIIIAYMVTQFINITLMNYYGNNILFFDFGIRQIVYITSFALFMTLISTLTPIRRLVMMKPIDVVRKK